MNIKKDFKVISKHYKKLIEMTNNHLFVGIVNEWIIDNYYLLLEQKQYIEGYLNQNKKKFLNNKNADILSIIKNIAIKNNYKIDEEIIVRELNCYQKDNNYSFSYQELDAIKCALSIAIVEKIVDICLIEDNELYQKNIIDKKILNIKRDMQNSKTLYLLDYFDFDSTMLDSSIVYISEQIKEFGDITSELFKQLDTILNKKNRCLRDILNKEHLANTDMSICITNSFYTINSISEIDIFDRVSKVEKLLESDYYYNNMTDTTKEIYRKQLIKNAKKNKKNVLVYAKELIGKKDHIGKYLFKPINFKKRILLYVIFVAFLTTIFSVLLSNFFLQSRIIGALILSIPISEFVITIINKILMKFFPCKPLMQMDFSENVPDEYKTMVVIPTIVSNTEKINSVFDNLETYYLSNRCNNLYFSLLADCSQSNTKFTKRDDAILKAGIEKTKELNEKYGKQLFYFALRNRIYNESEECWLGYERKRGGLLHFNDLILNNLTANEKKEYFYGHTFDDFNQKIKYVITLDVDTKLLLNSAQKLIGTMAHPLNTPILNQQKTIVVDGYGIMQPKVNIDIESTNKSLFSQVYAGIGGFDSYNTISPNFYQDVFGEGSFIGKGIYDLEVFQTVLKNKFPENLILSHDLIEGSYIRCANISNVELIDDFPSKFMVDATRRSRWARGDFQIINWLARKVKTSKNIRTKNEISLLSQWKIFDNIRRALLDFNFLIILITSLFCGVSNPIWWILFIIIILMLPVVFQLLGKLKFTDKRVKRVKYYNMLTFGNKALLFRVLSVFINIPFNSYLYLNSFCKSFYRMFISKKRLLNWITSEEAEKLVKTNFSNILKLFWMNYLISILLIIGVLILKENILIGIVLSFLFLSAPIINYLMSKDINLKKDILLSEDKDYLLSIAKKTWNFFSENLNKENNFLIPDNYQLNRLNKVDTKTSSTNIGLSLTSIVSAAELKIITNDKAKLLIKNVIDTIIKLEKWNGHLYNWYNIKTLEVMPPHFVSSVDSGNFVACLIVTKEYLLKNKETELSSIIINLINNTDFSVLYNKNDLFSIGYNDEEDRLEQCSYDRFASEARIASFVAIAKGDIPSQNWFNLDKTLTTHNNSKGLISWSGTSFEYFMPLIFLSSFPNTLLDETYDFAHRIQKSFIKEVDSKLPWGISESAYNELDDSQNYKYKAFGTPYLKLKEEPVGKIVIAPYASIIAISKYPKSVIENMKNFEKYNMLNNYGFFESYDVDDNIPVYSYYAHHQGMIMASLANCLDNNIIQNYFLNDVNNKAFEILTKEKVQLNSIINLKVMKYKKYVYPKEEYANDIRIFRDLSLLPEISVLSNAKYTLLINERGNGFSRFRTIQLNRYRKITEQNYGMFLYIKDIDTNKVWSNTYAPTDVQPDKYEVVFNLDRIKFVRTDNNVITTTEIVVTKLHNAEIRKITFKNKDTKDKKLEITSYFEPVLCDNNDDIAHRTFNNMFINTEYNKETDSIIMKRKSKISNSTYYMINRLLIENPNSKYQYETDRVNFIGRNQTASNPKAINEPLTNYVGTSLDPIASLRNQITIEKGKEKTIYLLVGFGKSKEQVMDIVNTYNNDRVIKEKAFEVATIMTNITNKMVNITSNDMRIYNTMLNYLYQTSRLSINEERIESLKTNTLSQRNLWRFGISGDRPIIFADVHEIENLSIVKELLHAFEYYKSKSIFVDLVFINSENENDAEIINSEIENEKYHMYAINSFHKIPGNIYVLNRNDVSKEEYTLLNTISRMKIDTAKYFSMHEFIEDLQKSNVIVNTRKIIFKQPDDIKYDIKSLTFFNEYGGFTNNGKEYTIVNRKTPTAWSNIIANKDFGTIVTNNNCGFTYAYNSHDYKITSWTNDLLLTDYSEAIKVNDINIDYSLAKHGFGYSEYNGKLNDLEIKLVSFVAKTDTVKFYKIDIKNTNKDKRNVNLKFWINPNLGYSEDKTSRHLLCDFNGKNNYVSIRNTYSANFSDVTVFMTCSEKIKDVKIDGILYKQIETEVLLDSNEEKEIIFTLGSSRNDDPIALIKKYQDSSIAIKEFDSVIDNWNSNLEVVKVNTPDKSFDYMLNGWLLYQTMSSRIFAKAGFYQVSGAFGFRDQLQDSMNICSTHPEITKQQIIANASHQFETGDVLHWWHEYNHFGLRSLYKDDYLWLIYAVSEYTKITGDYDFLNVQIPFVEGEALKENESERGIDFTYTKNTASLLEHCTLALKKSMRELGSNGLPLMGGGDWNDGMNKIGIKGKGTSVWLGFFLYLIVEKYSEMMKQVNSKINLKEYIEFNKKLKLSLETVAWDGEYYMRAFFDNGNKLGSKENKECSIDLISQCFAILTGITDEKRTSSILKSIDEKLVDNNINIVKLLDPPFANPEDNPGYIMNYPKGIRENGGQYTHAVSWYIMALVKLSKFDEAFKIYQMVNPINRTLTKKMADMYKVEPYVIAADIYSNPDYYGRGGWTWYTGSAGWFYKIGLVDILGFNKVGNKLYIKPNVPSKWTNYNLEYKYGNSIYKIEVNKKSDKNNILINKKIIKTDYINLIDDGKTYDIVVNIGGKND